MFVGEAWLGTLGEVGSIEDFLLFVLCRSHVASLKGVGTGHCPLGSALLQQTSGLGPPHTDSLSTRFALCHRVADDKVTDCLRWIPTQRMQRCMSWKGLGLVNESAIML